MAFNFFNRFYYGKAGQADYTPDRLPANRRALFFEMLRVRLGGLVGVNLLYLAFCLPALIWSFINLQVLVYALQTEEQTSLSALSGMLSWYLLGMIPCLTLAGVGATGEMYVLRNWARDQHAFVLSDFKDAVKGNWRCGLAVGLINGLSLFLGYICYMFYGQMAAQSPLWLVPQMLSLTLCGVWWMMNMVIFPMMVTYDMKLGHLIRNSAIIVVARLPWSILFLAGTVGVPVAVALLFFPSGALGITIIYLVIGFALTGFIYASYANSCFDKYLNPRIEGAQVGRGLRQADEDEDLDQVEDPNPLI